MSATTYGPTVPVFTPARVTRIAKQAAPELRWSSEKGARGVLVRVWDAPEGTEVRTLNVARRLINETTELTASVVSLRSRGGRPVFRILVTSEAQEAAQMQEAADRRAAALAEGMREVEAAQAARRTVREPVMTASEEARLASVKATVARAATAPRITEDPSIPGSARSIANRLMAEQARQPAPEASAAPRCGYCKGEGMELTSGGPSPLPCPDCGTVNTDAPAGELTYRSIRARAYEVLSGGQVIGRVARTVHSSDALLWEAFRPGGGSAGHGQTRPEAARTLLRAPAEPAVEPSASVPCWHVETAHGALYGVAATSLRDALQMTQDRLTGERSSDLPKRGQRVGTWQTAYGTVLCYRGPAE